MFHTKRFSYLSIYLFILENKWSFIFHAKGQNVGIQLGANKFSSRCPFQHAFPSLANFPSVEKGSVFLRSLWALVKDRWSDKQERRQQREVWQCTLKHTHMYTRSYGARRERAKTSHPGMKDALRKLYTGPVWSKAAWFASHYTTSGTARHFGRLHI